MEKTVRNQNVADSVEKPAADTLIRKLSKRFSRKKKKRTSVTEKQGNEGRSYHGSHLSCHPSP